MVSVLVHYYYFHVMSHTQVDCSLSVDGITSFDTPMTAVTQISMYVFTIMASLIWSGGKEVAVIEMKIRDVIFKNFIPVIILLLVD